MRLCVLRGLIMGHYRCLLTYCGIGTDRGLVLVVLTLVEHNNLLLVKQVSSGQKHDCLHANEAGEELEIDLGRDCVGLGLVREREREREGEMEGWREGGKEGGRERARGLFSCITEHWRVALNRHNTN